jgi:hypothetical protein
MIEFVLNLAKLCHNWRKDLFLSIGNYPYLLPFPQIVIVNIGLGGLEQVSVLHHTYIWKFETYGNVFGIIQSTKVKRTIHEFYSG